MSEQSTESAYGLTDNEWAWIEPMLRAGANKSAAKDALRGYLNDRIVERIVAAEDAALGRLGEYADYCERHSSWTTVDQDGTKWANVPLGGPGSILPSRLTTPPGQAGE